MTNQVETSLGIPRDEFLAHVRRSLGRGPDVLHPDVSNPVLQETLAQMESRAEEARRRLEAERESLVDRFAETAQLRNWNLFRTGSSEDAVSYIVEVAQAHSGGQVARSDQSALTDLPLDDALESLGIRSVLVKRGDERTQESLRQQVVESGVGVTGADFGVAETGSVVVLPRQGLSRLVSLVPPVHVAVVRPQDVVGSLDDVFLFRRVEYHRNGGEMGSYVNFITGPSRTADIEMKLVVGVHGPREVHLVLLG